MHDATSLCRMHTLAQARTARTVTLLTSTQSGAERQKRTAATMSCACSAAAGCWCWLPAAAACAAAGAAAAAPSGNVLAGVLFPAAPVRKDCPRTAAGVIVLTRSGTPRAAASRLHGDREAQGSQDQRCTDGAPLQDSRSSCRAAAPAARQHGNTSRCNTSSRTAPGACKHGPRLQVPAAHLSSSAMAHRACWLTACTPLPSSVHAICTT